MYLIKLNAIASTNTYLMAMAKTMLPKDYMVVLAEHQTEGKGQKGLKWQSEKGKNLTASVFKKIANFNADKHFFISKVVSLSICKALSVFEIPKLSIKWPNDILSENKKICGILIENILKNRMLRASVIGFGLNINQTVFNDLPKASSMALQTGALYTIEDVLSEILKQLKTYFQLLERQCFSEITMEYERLLFRKDMVSTFKTHDEKDTFEGVIKGVTQLGMLKVCTEEGLVKTFNLKALKLVY